MALVLAAVIPLWVAVLVLAAVLWEHTNGRH